MNTDMFFITFIHCGNHLLTYSVRKLFTGFIIAARMA